jgi:hypothetical protein
MDTLIGLPNSHGHDIANAKLDLIDLSGLFISCGGAQLSSLCRQSCFSSFISCMNVSATSQDGKRKGRPRGLHSCKNESEVQEEHVSGNTLGGNQEMKKL